MRLRAPAKLTWSLEITGVRPDGFHLLRSEMMTLDLADVVEIDEAAETTVTWSGPYADQAPRENSSVERALALAGRTATVSVDKQIPAAGGLGGGSADAAAVLRWSGVDDPTAALALGADVPFCLVGGRAMVTGIGEVVEALPFVERTVTIVTSSLSVSTPRCYDAFDELVASGAAPSGRNHLEAAACMVEPRLAEAMAWLRSRGLDVQLCGSGSSMFIEGSVGDGTLDSPVGELSMRVCRATPAL